MYETMQESYSAFAPFYRQLAWNMNLFANEYALINGVLCGNEHSKQYRILDAACGTGDVLHEMMNNGYDAVLGSDVCSEMMSLAEPKIASRLYQCSWEELGNLLLNQQLRDVVFILANSLAHMPPDRQSKLFASVYEGLSPNGLFIFDIRDWARERLRMEASGGRWNPSGKCAIGGHRYIVSERRVLTSDSIQEVTYKIEHDGGSCCGSAGSKCIPLRYHIFSEAEVLPKLEAVGFRTVEFMPARTIATGEHKWPYALVVARK